MHLSTSFITSHHFLLCLRILRLTYCILVWGIWGKFVVLQVENQNIGKTKPLTVDMWRDQHWGGKLSEPNFVPICPIAFEIFHLSLECESCSCTMRKRRMSTTVIRLQPLGDVQCLSKMSERFIRTLLGLRLTHRCSHTFPKWLRSVSTTYKLSWSAGLSRSGSTLSLFSVSSALTRSRGLQHRGCAEAPLPAVEGTGCSARV